MTHEMIGRLRLDLSDAGFTVDALDELWGAAAAAALFRGRRVPAQRALDALASVGSSEPVATLARLFVLGLPAATEAVASALPALGVAGATELGLIAVDDGEIRPRVDLRPYAFADAHGPGAWWIASDPGELATGRALAEDHVLGIGGASLTLSGLMAGDRVERVLDLGTGSGIQALHAARFADHVIATDISARALGFARLNAELNGVSNIEFRLGDLFEPVAGEVFDQIVSNPPFVITPRVGGVPTYEYRDGGMVGDVLVREVVRGIAHHLVPGGIAQLLGNWEYRADADGLDRVAGWLDELAGEDAGLDAWIVERETQDPAEYAETWIRDGGTRADMPGYERLYRAWLDDFAARGVTAVGFGYLTLRRPVGEQPTLRRLERVETHGANETGLGVHIAATLTAHDWLAEQDDARLVRARLVVAPDVTEERHYWPGAEDPTVIALHAGGGLGRIVPTGTGLAAFVGACDGELAVGAILGAIAQLLDVEDDALAAELLPQVRELVAIGMLAPA